MAFKANGALFRQTPEQLQQRLGDRYDPTKNYPEMDGVMNVTKDQVHELVQYLVNAEPQGDRQEIPVRISGWTKTANSGKKYVSLSFQPDGKVQKQIEQRSAPAAPAPAPALQQQTWVSAQPDEDDLPF